LHEEHGGPGILVLWRQG